MLKVEGLRETLQDLRSLSKDARDDMKETHRNAGEVVAALARSLAPSRTGQLSKTIRSNPTQRQGRITIGRGASVPYAAPIHFGWPARRIKPQPFVYDALDSRRDEVLRLYEERVGLLIDKHKLGPGQRSTSNT
jgi:HK97 gp10 family phage protein